MEANGSSSILRSLFTPEVLVPRVEAAYGLTITRIRLIKAMVLDTYSVWTNRGPSVLRIYPGRRRTLAEIEAEVELLLHLHSHDAPVSIPLAQQNGERLLALDAPEGMRYAALFTYADGKPVGEDLAAARTLGMTLAQIHSSADHVPFTLARTPLDLACLLDRPLEQLVAFEHWHQDWQFLRQVADMIRAAVMCLPTAPPHYGYCHGDAGGNNAHVNADGQVTWFDFDFCGLGWRAYDVGVCLSGETAEFSQAFLEGYEGVRPLTPAEHTAIPFFQMAQSIWMLGLRASYVHEWGEIYFADRFIDGVLQGIRTTFEATKLHNRV